jgi:hypothetical protein
MREVDMKLEKIIPALMPWVLIIAVSAMWFYVGTQYGYKNRDTVLYARGYKDGQNSIFDVAMIRIRYMEKEIDRLKMEKNR